MEERKSIKISISTLLLIFAIIVIIVMAYFIYQFYNEKTNALTQVDNLNNQVSSLESTVNNLQETIDSKSNTNSTDLDKENNEANYSEKLMERIYLQDKFDIENFSYTSSVTKQHGYITVVANDSNIEYIVSDTEEKLQHIEIGTRKIVGCDEKVVDIALEDYNGHINSIFLLTNSGNVYACNIRFRYNANDEINAKLILSDVVSIRNASVVSPAEGQTSVIAIKEDGSYEVCFDEESDGMAE